MDCVRFRAFVFARSFSRVRFRAFVYARSFSRVRFRAFVFARSFFQGFRSQSLASPLAIDYGPFGAKSNGLLAAASLGPNPMGCWLRPRGAKSNGLCPFFLRSFFQGFRTPSLASPLALTMAPSLHA
jgi:hypothetical protein